MNSGTIHSRSHVERESHVAIHSSHRPLLPHVSALPLLTTIAATLAVAVVLIVLTALHSPVSTRASEMLV